MLIRGASFGFAAETAKGDYLGIAVATIVGVIAGTLIGGLRQLPPTERVSVSKLLDILLRPQMFIAFCVSPVVLYGVLAAANSSETGVLTILAAFQNGFFWEQVLKRQGP